MALRGFRSIHLQRDNILANVWWFIAYRHVVLVIYEASRDRCDTVIHADNVIRRRRYCDHIVTMCVCVCMYVRVWVCACEHGKTKTPDRNDLKLGAGGGLV